MINFRYHLVSLAAVFLALAVGISLGAGWLHDDDDNQTTSEARVDPAVTSFETSFANRAAPGLVNGALAERRVLIVTAAGARSAEVEGLKAVVQQAGGAVVGEVALTPKLLDASNRQFAESVAQEAAGQAEGVAESGDSYGRVGAALARALVSADDPALDEAASTIRSAFTEGGLIDLSTAPTQRANAVLVVTGSGSSGSDARGSILADITAQFAAAGAGSALVGPSVSSNDGGMLAQARGSASAGTFSTVDVTDAASGRVVAVMALARSIAGNPGSWGTTRSADGAVPD